MGAAATSGLQLAGLTVGYAGARGARAVLSDVVASARPGAVTAVLGPNGAGKSTLLRTVAGLQPALAGTGSRVVLDGATLAALSPRERARRVAVLLTDRVEVGLMTGAEVVDLGRHPYGGLGGSRAADRAAARRALELLQADELAGRRFAEMSDGQRQRVLLARALAQQPRLLVLDEPTAYLDVGSRVDLLVLLAALARDLDLVVLVSTHEVELALRLCAACWLIDGRRLLTDEPERLIADGAVQRVFETAGTVFDPVSRTFHERVVGQTR